MKFDELYKSFLKETKKVHPRDRVLKALKDKKQKDEYYTKKSEDKYGVKKG